MTNVFVVMQIVSGVTLIILILIQSKGKGFARSSGGSASFTRRGLEKVVFKLSFILAAIFIVISILQLAL